MRRQFQTFIMGSDGRPKLNDVVQIEDEEGGRLLVAVMLADGVTPGEALIWEIKPKTPTPGRQLVS